MDIHTMIELAIKFNNCKKNVSIHRAPHLLCCRALEVQKYVRAPDALHLRHPVNAYNEVV